MKKTITLATVALSALALSACGSEAASSSDPVSVAPVPTETQVATDDLTERGTIPMEVGETGHLSTFEGEETVGFTVNSIEPIECTQEFYEGPDNGVIYAVDMSIKTTAAMEPHSMSFNGFSWKYISDEGTTFNGDLASMAAYSCLPESELIRDDFGPGENLTGLVLLDLPAESGTLVLTPDYATGFEYELGN